MVGEDASLKPLPSMEWRVNSASRCLGHAGGMTNPPLGWGGVMFDVGR